MKRPVISGRERRRTKAMKGVPRGTPFIVELQLAAPSKLLARAPQYTQIALRPIVAWFFFAMPLSSTNGALSDESYRPSARSTRLLPNPASRHAALCRN